MYKRILDYHDCFSILLSLIHSFSQAIRTFKFIFILCLNQMAERQKKKKWTQNMRFGFTQTY